MQDNIGFRLIIPIYEVKITHRAITFVDLSTLGTVFVKYVIKI